MTKDEQIAEASASLVLAINSMEAPVKNTKGYGYEYADLTEIVKVVKAALTKNSLAFVQTLNSCTEEAYSYPEHVHSWVHTKIIHKNGYVFDGGKVLVQEMEKTKKMNDLQAFGAAITYTKRYALASYFGLVSDDDIDGASLEKPAESKPNIEPESWLIDEAISVMTAMPYDAKNDIGFTQAVSDALMKKVYAEKDPIKQQERLLIIKKIAETYKILGDHKHPKADISAAKEVFKKGDIISIDNFLIELEKKRAANQKTSNDLPEDLY